MTEEYKSSYSSLFYNQQKNASYTSASRIIPVLNSLLSPNSVIDLGCGVGTFLKAFIETDIDDVIGVDGAWVDKSLLYIPQDKFIEHDFCEPFHLERKFDLAMSLEVAEHLSDSSAINLVNSCALLSDYVLFSAAIPFQGGANHVNEHWQSYWVEKFRMLEYELVDIIRPLIWHDEFISGPYRQNILLFISSAETNSINILKHNYKDNVITDLVHPQCFTYKVHEGISKITTKRRTIKHIVNSILKKLFFKKYVLQRNNSDYRA